MDHIIVWNVYVWIIQCTFMFDRFLYQTTMQRQLDFVFNTFLFCTTNWAFMTNALLPRNTYWTFMFEIFLHWTTDCVFMLNRKFQGYVYVEGEYQNTS